MRDESKIFAIVLILFVFLFTLPFWYNLGKASKIIEPELSLKAKQEKFCVESKDYMKANHMQLLDEWRDSVVREGKRHYIGKNGKEYKNLSLQNTCMDCHHNKKEFCDKCHNYVGVTPYCWTCHIEPKG
jgi:hypothetical protein